MTELETELRIAWATRRRCQEKLRQADDADYYTRVLAQWRYYITRLVRRIRAERTAHER